MESHNDIRPMPDGWFPEWVDVSAGFGTCGLGFKVAPHEDHEADLNRHTFDRLLNTLLVALWQAREVRRLADEGVDWAKDQWDKMAVTDAAS